MDRIRACCEKLADRYEDKITRLERELAEARAQVHSWQAESEQAEAEVERLREVGGRLLRSQPAAADAHPDGSSSLTYSASEWEEMVQACAAMRTAIKEPTR